MSLVFTDFFLLRSFSHLYVKHFELPPCMKCATQMNLPCLMLAQGNGSCMKHVGYVNVNNKNKSRLTSISIKQTWEVSLLTMHCLQHIQFIKFPLINKLLMHIADIALLKCNNHIISGDWTACIWSAIKTTSEKLCFKILKWYISKRKKRS